MRATTAKSNDPRDTPVSSTNATSLADYEIALQQFQSYRGDPTETLQVTLKNDPDFVLGHVFMANAMLLMAERQYVAPAIVHIEAAEALHHKANDRERLLTKAARYFADGRWDKALDCWDENLVKHPTDAMVIQSAHLTDFLLGDAINLRDRVARVLPQWDDSMPGFSYVLGLHAFGLEECNQYELAEEMGRKALAIEPNDGWSVHAVVHVMEMQKRFEEGAEFLRDRERYWAPDNGFAYHNWWHLALFMIEQEDFGAALKLYDEKILQAESDVSYELLDCSALLWRLALQGVELGDRWQVLSGLWQKKTPEENAYYPFNDFHTITALVGAGDFDTAFGILEALEKASTLSRSGALANEIGVHASQAIIAFAREQYDEVISLLRPLRSVANRFGGSHAQRDILSLTLFEAAVRGGDLNYARALLNERHAHKPNSPLGNRLHNKLTKRAKKAA